MNGGTTELGELLQFILQHGFSVVVAAYLLVRLEKKMTDLTEAITELRHCMEVKVARFEAHLSRNTAPDFSPEPPVHPNMGTPTHPNTPGDTPPQAHRHR